MTRPSVAPRAWELHRCPRPIAQTDRASRLGEVELDGGTMRRTRGGDLTLSYPSRRDRRGQDHPYLRPRTESARLHIEAQVFEALGLGEDAR